MELKLLTFAVVLIASQVDGRGMPPTIRVPGWGIWKDPHVVLRKGQPETLQCQADGSPKPTYKWVYEAKDGSQVEVQNNSYISYGPMSGNLSVLYTDLNGYDGDANYSCIALNANGKAMTPPVSVEQSAVISFPGEDNQRPEEWDAFVSQTISLPCTNLKDLDKSKPPVEVVWSERIEETDRQSTVKLKLKKNMAVDPEGTLHFLWVTEEDLGKTYVCGGVNKKELLTSTNTHSIKLKKITGFPEKRTPKIIYIADVTAMAKTTAELTCIISYYSPTNETLRVSWYLRGKKVGEGMTLKRQVEVPDNTQDMSGQYLCEAELGTSGTGKTEGRLDLNIISPPQFIQSEKLMAKAVPLGRDAVFQCGTSSYRAYQDAPVWYVNAERLKRPDECPGSKQFACPERNSNGELKCVPKCDSMPDCRNGEDEKGCPGSNCGEKEKLCHGQCIDSKVECAPCVYPNFPCKDSSGCIEQSRVCDGKKDCGDSSDEDYCPGGKDEQIGRFTLSSDRRTLTLPAVTLNDQMCFQCSVKNQYGMVFSDGCLTVIDKIVVQYKPNDTYHVEPGMFINIYVDATTDLQYQQQMSYSWYMYNETRDEDGNVLIDKVQICSGTGPGKKCPEPNLSGPLLQYFNIMNNGRNFTMIIPDTKNTDETSEKYDAYIALTNDRKYAVEIYHPFESVLLNFSVIGKEIKPPVPEQVVTQASFNYWIIAIILAVLVLFIVIALIVCYMYRNRGGTYPLDKKEHQAGHDPAQELKDNAFHDVGRVDDEDDYDKPRADEVSLSDSVKPYVSDDDETVEYAEDHDLSQFNEQGSFIFQYGDKKSKAKEVTV